MSREVDCDRCGEAIVFLRGDAGRWVPVDADTVGDGDTEYEPRSGHVDHRDSCVAGDVRRGDARGG